MASLIPVARSAMPFCMAPIPLAPAASVKACTKPLPIVSWALEAETLRASKAPAKVLAASVAWPLLISVILTRISSKDIAANWVFVSPNPYLRKPFVLPA